MSEEELDAECMNDDFYFGYNEGLETGKVARDALRAELAAVKEALEPFAKLNVTRFMTDGIKYQFRVDAKDIRRARARIDAVLKGGEDG